MRVLPGPPDTQHRHDLDEAWSVVRDHGEDVLVQCEDCGAWFYATKSEGGWQWWRVEWWHFRRRRRIREAA